MEEFNEAKFKTKVNNIFVKLFTCVMKGNLEEVRHFISEDVYNKYSSYIESLNSNNERQMYDELNVKDTIIEDRSINDEEEIVRVRLISRYMDYVIDKNTYMLKRGVNTSRIMETYRLIFTKKLDSKEIKNVRKCPTCGSSIDVNNSGVCPFCKNIYNWEDYDYYLESIERI